MEISNIHKDDSRKVMMSMEIKGMAELLNSS